MSILLYLARHGETDWNRLGLCQGTMDVPLNPRGVRQAEELAGHLRAVALDACYTSPLRRALGTAETVLCGRAIETVVLPELRELCYGLWQGRSAYGQARCNPGLEWRWRHSPWTVRFPGGETLAEAQTRAIAALRRIRAAHPGGRVLVCGHGHLNRLLLIHSLGLPRESFWAMEQLNGTCSVLEIGAGGARLIDEIREEG